MNTHQLLIEKIRQADRAGAATLLDAWGQEYGYDRLLAEVLEPALLEVGEAWRAKQSFTVAQAYIAAKIAQDTLTRIAEMTPAGAPAVKGPVVLGNIEEDFHSLGRQMVTTFLRIDGWQVYDLGNDVAAATFVDEAQAVDARVIGASAMMYSTAQNIRQLRQEIDRRGLAGKIQLAVGGAVFQALPGLAQQVGGDGTAANALEASRLFERLWQCAVERSNS